MSRALTQAAQPSGFIGSLGAGGKGFLGIGTSDFGFAGIDEVMNRQARIRAAAEGRLDTSAPFVPAGDAIDKLFGVPGTVGPRRLLRCASLAGWAIAHGAAAAGRFPWEGFAPGDMRDLFKGSIDVNLKDPGKVVDSVEVKNPGKTLGPVNPRSGTK